MGECDQQYMTTRLLQVINYSKNLAPTISNISPAVCRHGGHKSKLKTEREPADSALKERNLYLELCIMQ